MSDQNVVAALQGRLMSYAQNKGLAVAFEGTPFTPDATKAHLADFLLPALTENPSLGRHHARLIGIYQVDVSAPLQSNAVALRVMANELAEHFYRGLSLTHGSGQVVLITHTPAISRIITDKSRMKRAVSIRYQSDVFG